MRRRWRRTRHHRARHRGWMAGIALGFAALSSALFPSARRYLRLRRM
jgi:hypothetical protein